MGRGQCVIVESESVDELHARRESWRPEIDCIAELLAAPVICSLTATSRLETSPRTASHCREGVGIGECGVQRCRAWSDRDVRCRATSTVHNGSSDSESVRDSDSRVAAYSDIFH